MAETEADEPKPEQEAPADSAPALASEPISAPATEPAPAPAPTPTPAPTPAPAPAPAPAPVQNAGYGNYSYYQPQGATPAPAVPAEFNQGPVPLTDEPPKKKKKGKNALIVTIAILCCAALAVLGIYSSLNGNTDSDKESSSTEETTTSEDAQVETEKQAEVATTDEEGNYTVAGVAENCIDSCVGITVYSKASDYSSFYNFGYGSDSNNSEETVSGYGSGIFMMESNGKTYVITCAHVISDGTSFVVTTNDGKEYNAHMVGYDSQTDIGVLSINETGFRIAEFADSSSTVVGEQVVAIGCPGGLDFMNSVSSGYVSALDRPISSTIGYKNECIQTDTAINPGNSGGALFNMQGQVIGVNSSKIAATEYEGIGFAVPSSTAISTANSIIRVGYVEGRAKIGITYTNIGNYSNSSAIIDALGRLGYDDAQGTMVINEITAGSDLAGKDVQQYDMIVAVNGQTLTSTDVMTAVLADSTPGDTVKLTIARITNNQIDTFEVDCKLIEARG